VLGGEDSAEGAANFGAALAAGRLAALLSKGMSQYKQLRLRGSPTAKRSCCDRACGPRMRNRRSSAEAQSEACSNVKHNLPNLYSPVENISL
jgi:hypothetical protein